MTTRKRKKRKRGSRTHGWGSQKKHRGAGNRGGRGMAGVGKRGGQKMTKYLAHGGKRPLGKHGMQITRQRPSLKGINIYQIEENLEEWVKSGIVKKQKGTYIINLKGLGYDKVLGQGKPEHKLKITAKAFSKSAEKKLESAGGEAIKEE